MVRKGLFIVLLVVGWAVVSIAQEPLYSQYMLNLYLINPAVAGAEGVTAFNLTAREQWLGYKDGPSTYALSAQTRILKTSFRNRSRLIKNRVRRRRPSGRVGMGAFIYNDVNGRVHRTGFQGTYGYHIYIRDLQLSFGVSLKGYQYKLDISPSDLYDPIDDPLVTAGKSNQKFSLDANFGTMISTEKYYAGISLANMFQNPIKFGGGNNESAYKQLRQYYLIGGYRLEPYRSDFAVEPSILLTLNERMLFSADINVKGYYKQDYWFGVSYRTAGSMVFMGGIKYQQFYFGYAFDYGFKDLSTLSNGGSHELMIGMKLGDSARRYRWLNRF